MPAGAPGMSEHLSEETRIQVGLLAQACRDEISDRLAESDARGDRIRLAVVRVIGAMAVGVLATGLSILGIVILLNIFFHFAPS